MDDVISKLNKDYPQGEWKRYPLDTRYIVNSTGLVWSTVSNILMKNSKLGNCLSVGINKSTPLHRVVAETFIPNPRNLQDVHHINHNTRDNKVSNLTWITSKDNLREAREFYNKGTDITKPARDALRKVVTKRVNQLDLRTGAIIATYNSIQEAQIAVGKTKTHTAISRAVQGTRNSAYGFGWKLVDESQLNRARRKKSGINNPNLPKIYQYTLEGLLVRTWENIYCPEQQNSTLRADGIQASFNSKKTDRTKLAVKGRSVGKYKGYIWVKH